MRRAENGNMLVLTGIFLMVLVIAVLLASSFGSLYFVHNRLQTTADQLALEGARKLNEQDRIGQMNNMIARCRQLVFDAGVSHESTEDHLAQLNDLSEKLHDEAREGATLLESERLTLRSVSVSESNAAIMNRFNEIKNGHELVLPWIQAAVPLSPQIKYGWTDKTESNVEDLDQISDLNNADQAQNYIAGDGSKLYKHNIDAKLPGSDSDLHFKLASLPAPVQNYVSPARAILSKSYKELSDEQLYSTVQVELKLELETGLGASGGGSMKTLGTAEATGGQRML
ncbi:MAG: Tad domain-containing protein [Candidatus Obscuribacterales bacterium]|nr:Tad domain-containing protein [Candidatus Obscuribacterales bacterium]